MKKIISIILLLLTCHTWIMAQINNIIPSAPSIANTPTARTDQWSAFANPASLTENKRFSFAFTYENKYLLAELSGKTAQAAYCNPWVNVGIAFTHFGYKQYSDIMAGICLSHDFSGKFSIGLQGNYYAAYFGSEAGYVYTIFPQVGATVHITPTLCLGFHAFNPFIQQLKGEFVSKQIPAMFSLGSEWRFYNHFNWLVQIDKEVQSPFRVATGFEYQVIKELGVKIGGYASTYFVPCFGINLNFSGWRFDINCELNPLLGVNTLGSVSFAI